MPYLLNQKKYESMRKSLQEVHWFGFMTEEEYKARMQKLNEIHHNECMEKFKDSDSYNVFKELFDNKMASETYVELSALLQYLFNKVKELENAKEENNKKTEERVLSVRSKKRKSSK